MARKRSPYPVRIVSGGQTGVDRAALDVALELRIACGGWCPRGRRAEDGPLPPCYPLQESPSTEYAERTEWNVRDSDATLVLTAGRPSGGTALTIRLARRRKKPCRVVDLDQPSTDVEAIRDWLRRQRVMTLNVAGPRESNCKGLQVRAADWLRRLLS